jgi:hypothetical protein
MENRGNARGFGVKTSLSRKDGEDLGVAGLGFLAGDSERLTRFLGLSGLGPDNLRAAAAAPGFLAAVLDYLLSDEPLLLAFAAEQGIGPERVASARRAMDGPG